MEPAVPRRKRLRRRVWVSAPGVVRTIDGIGANSGDLAALRAVRRGTAGSTCGAPGQQTVVVRLRTPHQIGTRTPGPERTVGADAAKAGAAHPRVTEREEP